MASSETCATNDTLISGGPAASWPHATLRSWVAPHLIVHTERFAKQHLVGGDACLFFPSKCYEG